MIDQTQIATVKYDRQGDKCEGKNRQDEIVRCYCTVLEDLQKQSE